MPKVSESQIETSLELISYVPDQSSFEIPLLFVHGMWHGAWCWDTFLPYFDSKGFHSTAMSLIGHGNSPKKRFFRFTRIKDYVKNLRSITEQYEKHPILVGHSMGGFIVQKYLEKYDAPGAILLATIPAKGSFTATLRFMVKHPIAFTKTNLTMQMKHVVMPKKLAKEYLFPRNISEEKVEEYYSQLQNEAYFAYLDTMLFSLPKPKKVDTPILVLGSDSDAFFKKKQFESTARAYNGDLKIFPGMAHNMMMEDNWTDVADEIILWCRNLNREP